MKLGSMESQMAASSGHSLVMSTHHALSAHISI